ncbi:MAG: hypothetical protein AB1394_09695 [Bacteroidota bacterium]
MISCNSNVTETKIDSALLEEAPINSKIETAYFLVKLKSSADFFSVFHYANSLEGVKESLAAKGDAEIILVVQKSSDEISLADLEAKLIAADGVSNVSCLQVAEHYAQSDKTEKGKVSSLLIMLVDDAKLVDITKELLLNKSVNLCFAVNGKYNLIAELGFGSFAGTDKFISNYVAAINGVLKVKELPIINLYE